MAGSDHSAVYKTSCIQWLGGSSGEQCALYRWKHTKGMSQKLAEPDLTLGLTPSFPQLSYANSLSEGLQEQQGRNQEGITIFSPPTTPSPPKMYHNPGTHTQQMVDSGINSGLPDFLHHKNLTLLPPPPTTSHGEWEMRIPRVRASTRQGAVPEWRWGHTGDHKEPCPQDLLEGSLPL